MARHRCERRRKDEKYEELRHEELSSFLYHVALSRRVAVTEHGYVCVMHLLPSRHRITARDRTRWPEGNTLHEGKSM